MSRPISKTVVTLADQLFLSSRTIGFSSTNIVLPIPVPLSLPPSDPFSDTSTGNSTVLFTNAKPATGTLNICGTWRWKPPLLFLWDTYYFGNWRGDISISLGFMFVVNPVLMMFDIRIQTALFYSLNAILVLSSTLRTLRELAEGCWCCQNGIKKTWSSSCNRRGDLIVQNSRAEGTVLLSARGMAETLRMCYDVGDETSSCCGR